MINPAYRVLDANLNRLREALRVTEEYFRFFCNDETWSVKLKGLRHALIGIESGLGADQLLENRDTDQDCFANTNRPEELERTDATSILRASFKRSQEASRVIEEYSKITEHPEVSEMAKTIRFTLYTLEKQFFTK